MKQRLIGAAVLALLAFIFLPMLLTSSEVREPDAAQVPLDMPTPPAEGQETREIPLDLPVAAPPGGVLGMDPQAAPAAVVPAGGSVTPAGSDDATAPAATGETGTPATSAAPAAPAPVPAATAPVSAVPPAAVAGGGYTVTIGSFANAQTARELENKLRSAGLAVRRDNVRIDGRDAVRLRVGPYADRALAEAARLRADTATGLQSRVDALDAAVAMPPPPRPASGTAATASAPRVAANVGFAVQLAAPASEGEANALRDRARAAGFVAFVQRVQTEGGARYRVRLGPEADRAAADALRAEARSKLGIDGIVVSHP